LKISERSFLKVGDSDPLTSLSPIFWGGTECLNESQ
jgi:hypothetical protein